MKHQDDNTCNCSCDHANAPLLNADDMKALYFASAEEAIDFVQNTELDTLGTLLWSLVTVNKDLNAEVDKRNTQLYKATAELTTANADKEWLEQRVDCLKHDKEAAEKKYYDSLVVAGHLRKALAHVAATLAD